LFDLKQQPHRRFNPLTNEWILVSPHRTQRPWQGKQERGSAPTQVTYDPDCYLCPGNARAGGVRNPEYKTTFVFENDFAALKPDTPEGEFREGDLLIARAESGVCKVVCFSPRHDLTLARMDAASIRPVVDTWTEQYESIGASPTINYVQIFENRGEEMGASNPHPHCQIWSGRTLPNEHQKELASQGAYLEKHGSCLLCDYVNLEARSRERIVFENEGFLVVVPFWAVWPFEVLCLSKRHVSSLTEFNDAERNGLCDALHRIAVRYDNVFETSFPYSMGFHQRPTDGREYPGWHFHAHYYPPLLRSAKVRKYMVGYEMLGMPQRDITPESAAERLRGMPEEHYLDLKTE
jgi:UDPglucose--hexose-1-phosphate uridylyltransferase